jgi:hypothetical protein
MGGAGQARGMPNPSDLAEMSTIRSQIAELTARVVKVAERYDKTPDSAIASDLFGAERALVNAQRSIDRAAAALA